MTQPRRLVVRASRVTDERGRIIPPLTHPTLPGWEVVRWRVTLDCGHTCEVRTEYDDLEGDSTTAPHKWPIRSDCDQCPPEDPPATPRSWWDRALRWLLGA